MLNDMIKRIITVAAALAAALSLFSCRDNASELIPVYGWTGVNSKMSDDEIRSNFSDMKDHGLDGICVNVGLDKETIARAARIAKELGLEYHAWIPCMPQGGKPHGWYAVNRLGEPADEHPAFVDHYRFLDPRNTEVREWLVSELVAVAEIPEVDYVQLDFIRFPDVILARGLWDKYGLDMTEEYAPADYCYCDDCVAAFKEQSGIDIREVEDPSKVKEWAQFRCDGITELVNQICEAVHARGKKVSADVFPGPASHAEWMVRQQWDKWDIDVVFPMNYNDFYLGDTKWVADVTAEEVASVPGKPVFSGLFICPDWQNKDKVTDPENSGLLPSEIEAAVEGSVAAGAAGICLFTPERMSDEHWDALAAVRMKLAAE